MLKDVVSENASATVNQSEAILKEYQKVPQDIKIQKKQPVYFEDMNNYVNKIAKD